MRAFLVLLFLPTFLAASDFAPDPLAVRKYGPAYCYPQAGWVVLHVEGKPHERGFQHGTLMAPEITAFVRCFAAQQNSKDPSAGWQNTRRLTSALFLRGFDREYLEEMQGIADGAAEAGATFDGKAIDLIDIAALNLWAEIDSLDPGLEAIPTGLEGIKFPGKKPRAMPATKGEHCSAFAATGPATADGKIVFGHITMFGLYPARFYNVWLDVKPVKGHRVLMQSYPGGIQSGMDYYLNDAGLIVSETTINQTRFNANGQPLASRIRKALQYGESIDDVVKILSELNNGLYTNEWLLADTKTNEIAMFELGTKATKLWRSSKDEWFGGTAGFYWGCNNAKDLQVRLETISDVKDRPHAFTWSPSNRDKKWLNLYAAHKGKITAETGQMFFSTPPLCASSSLDAKVTSTALAKELKTLAIFGPPIGGTWPIKDEERSEYPEIVPLVPNDWTTLHPAVPRASESAKVADWPDKVEGFRSFESRLPDEMPSTKPAWHGTLLPKSDDDLWLTLGFAAYERLVAVEQTWKAANDKGELSADEKERLAIDLNQIYLALRKPSFKKWEGVPEGDPNRDRFVAEQTARGVAILQRLHREVGTEKFADGMDEFGLEHAGQTVAAVDFARFVESKWKIKVGVNLPKWVDEAAVGPKFTIRSWVSDQEHSVIVYGTTADVVANRETAESLQRAIAKQGTNIIVPVVSDTAALNSATHITGRHVLLIGGPSTNKLAAKWQKSFPVTFGPGSVKVRDDWYSHPGTAVLAAGPNPLSGEFSAVAIVGLSAESTQFAPAFLRNGRVKGNVVVLPNGAKARSHLYRSRRWQSGGVTSWCRLRIAVQ